MPKTEYRFYRIATGWDNRRGPPWGVPSMRIGVGMSGEIAEIPLTEGDLLEIIRQSASALEFLATRRLKEAS